MRTNEQDALTGRRVRLVPYRAAHVPQYHAWMEVRQVKGLVRACAHAHRRTRHHGFGPTRTVPRSQDALLREQTGSEPLTLEEEFDMQQRWQADPDKLCFILLDTCEPGAPMAGDVNMFLLDDDQLGPGWGEVEVPFVLEAEFGRAHACIVARAQLLSCFFTRVAPTCPAPSYPVPGSAAAARLDLAQPDALFEKADGL